MAHVLFGGGKIVEVATFRRNPEGLEDEDDLLIRSDNVFGDAHEDAIRRDFTINALFYEPARHQVLDWCGGVHDLEQRLLRTIGDPNVRFREDPVRILRVIKFAARADLGIDPAVYDAMVAHREDLGRAARPRIFEEVLRLMREGASHRAMYLMWETGVMAVLLPELAAYLDDDSGDERALFFGRLDAIDARKRAGRPVDDVVLMSALLRAPMLEACEGERDVGAAVLHFLEPIAQRIALPRRIGDAIRRIAIVQGRLSQGRLGRFAHTELAGLALDMLEVETRARGGDLRKIERMRAELPAPSPDAPDRRPRRRPRRRRS